MRANFTDDSCLTSGGRVLQYVTFHLVDAAKSLVTDLTGEWCQQVYAGMLGHTPLLFAIDLADVFTVVGMKSGMFSAPIF